MSQSSLQQLQSEITAANAAIATETKNRTIADTNEVSARQQADANEANRAQSAEAGLASRIAGLESSVTTLRTTIAALQSTATTLLQQMAGALAAIATLQAAPAPAPDPAPVPAPTPVTNPPPAPVPAPQAGLPQYVNALPRGDGFVLERGELFLYPVDLTQAPDYVFNGQTIKHHFWGARVYTGTFVVKNTIDDLIAAKLIPPHTGPVNITARWKELGGYDANGLPMPITYAGPMDWQLASYMGQTGDQYPIGWNDEWGSAYATLKNPALLSSIEALARNALTLPIHVRDPKTGRPVSYKDYPDFSTFMGQENSMINPAERTAIVGVVPPPFFPDPGLMYDPAHAGVYWYLLGCLTENPLCLEELQTLCTFNWSTDYPNVYLGKPHIENLQVREMAHDLRTLCDTIALTRYFEKKGILPPYCHGSQYWIDTMLVPTMAWFSPFFGDTSPASFSKVLMWAPFVYAPWQWDMLGTAAGVGIFQGITELWPLFNWVAAALKERLTGSSGWDPRLFTWYYTQNPTDWSKTACDAVKAGDASIATDDLSKPFNPGLMDGYSDYAASTGTVVRVGKLIGHPDMVALSPGLDDKLKLSGIPINYRHAIG